MSDERVFQDEDETYIPQNPDEDETYIPDEDDDIIEGETFEDDENPTDMNQPENMPDGQSDAPQPGRANGAPQMISSRSRQKSANRLAIFPLAMGFIGLGLLLLAEDYVEELTVSSGASVIILIGSLVLTYIFRFFTSGRRERGLFFLAVVTTAWGSLLALTIVDGESFPFDEFWPLLLAGVGVAFFLTFLFERSHQIGLVFPGVILMFASGIAFLVTLDVIDAEMQSTIADYWPLLLAFLGLTLLPSALQEEL